jgi:uncharacterized cupredoxin-like copper-binding protein
VAHRGLHRQAFRHDREVGLGEGVGVQVHAVEEDGRQGLVTFTIKNTGKVNHDLKINGKTSSMVKPGKSTNFTVKFSKAGKYKFLCTVPGHVAAGMKGTLTVS